MSNSVQQHDTLRLALPKGRMEQGVLTLLADAGVRVTPTARGYRPSVSLPNAEAKVLKSQNIVEMLALGSRDLGFAGADWVAELEVEVVELLDTGLDPVQVVAAAPAALLEEGHLPARRLVVASEYERLSQSWIGKRQLEAEFVRSYGATEVFPPEDADVIVDNTATGGTLRANGLEIVEVLMRSSTRLYANPRALEDPERRRAIEELVMLLFGPVRQVYAELNRQREGVEVDDDSFLALTNASGVHSHLWMSALAAQPGPRLRVLGSRAAYTKYGMDVQEEALRQGVRPEGDDWGEEPEARWGTIGAGDELHPVRTEPGAYPRFYAGVAAALREGAPPPVDPQDAIATLEVIEVAFRSAVEGRVVTLPALTTDITK